MGKNCFFNSCFIFENMLNSMYLSAFGHVNNCKKKYKYESFFNMFLIYMTFYYYDRIWAEVIING